MLSYLLVIGCLLNGTLGLYDQTDDVVELNSNNFGSKVKNDEFWIVEFYAPWCGHCKSLAPEYKKAAKQLKGVANVGAVDCTQNQQICSVQYGVQGYPTIKVFTGDKNKPSDYQGERSASGFVDAALKAQKQMVMDRVNGGSGKSGGGGGESDAVELTVDNFDELVLQSDDMWLVEFFAPWCGHCKRLEPEWNAAAGELKGRVKLGVIDATVHAQLGQRFGVGGYPTIKYFPPGAESDSGVQEYEGGRTASDIVAWALERYEVTAPEVVELTSQTVFQDNCGKGKRAICIIAFLPNILDTGAEGRNNYIGVLKEMAEKYKVHNWGYLWTEAGAHESLEQSLSIGGAGYPALIAVNTKKAVALPHRGGFSRDSITSFLQYAKTGRIAPQKIGTLQIKESIAAWDGKDGEDQKA